MRNLLRKLGTRYQNGNMQLLLFQLQASSSPLPISYFYPGSVEKTCTVLLPLKTQDTKLFHLEVRVEQNKLSQVRLDWVALGFVRLGFIGSWCACIQVSSVLFEVDSNALGISTTNQMQVFGNRTIIFHPCFRIIFYSLAVDTCKLP